METHKTIYVFNNMHQIDAIFSFILLIFFNIIFIDVKTNAFGNFNANQIKFFQ